MKNHKNEIILDALNCPCPKAFLNEWYDHFEEKEYYSISIAADLDSPKFRTAEEALVWVKNNGFEAKHGKDGHGKDFWKLTHTATQKELDRLIEASEEKWENAKNCYVRYGDLPENGRSKNHANGILEKGVSVFYGECLDSGEARALPRTNQELGSSLYIVDGEEIGFGSDGEPVLQNAKIIREAKK